ncbi:hypothetical protein BJP24_07730 [Aeromonas allosaccharophila]|uniref:DUF6161 domain-containing protein n=1 Tax=Aeromonas allosaccharophila TaxID=656 RepID=UPI0005B2243C|nr:DUF6161 domain-containing protein [Aeromonas allosaccharophila]OKP45091.1 hypothetical protein BJP24_07730 [Aeromonas allosaccharophila]
MDHLDIINKEFLNWKWLLSYPNILENLNAYRQFFNLFQNEKPQDSDFIIKGESNESTLEDITAIFSTTSYIMSTSSKGRFICSIQEKEIAAECLLAFVLGVDKRTQGIINAIFYKKGFKRELASEQEKINETIRDLKKKSKEYDLNIEELLNNLNNELRIGQQAVIELTSACNSLRIESDKQKKAVLDIEEIKNNLDGALKLELESKIRHASQGYDDSIKVLREALEAEKLASKQRFDSFVDAYKNKMKLKAPVQYWSENVRHHKKSAFRFGMASIFLSLIIFLPIAYVAWQILASEQIIWGKVGVVAFTTSLAIWLIRILVRMYLSHNHMQMNSQERVVMTQAYLALISEGGASSNEERNLVLQAIFRPVSTGIITDDASPHSLVEFINKIKK